MSLEQWGGIRAAGACDGHQHVGVWSAMTVGGNPTVNDCMARQKRSGGVDLLWEQGGKNEFLKSGIFEEGGRRDGWKRQRHVRRGPIPAHRGERDTAPVAGGRWGGVISHFSFHCQLIYIPLLHFISDVFLPLPKANSQTSALFRTASSATLVHQYSSSFLGLQNLPSHKPLNMHQCLLT